MKKRRKAVKARRVVVNAEGSYGTESCRRRVSEREAAERWVRWRRRGGISGGESVERGTGAASDSSGWRALTAQRGVEEVGPRGNRRRVRKAVESTLESAAEEVREDA